MRRLVLLFAAVLTAAVLASAGAVRAGAVVKISGGGTAVFDNAPGGTTFSIQAHVDEDGNPKGHFGCVIPGIVAIAGTDLREATLNADGSVTLAGFAHGFDVAVGAFSGMPFEVRVWSGGPGVGRFIYDDPVVGTALVDTDVEGDHETVATGHIFIR